MASEPFAEPEATPSGADPPDPVDWVEAHGDALYRYARKRVESSHEAEDLVQETFAAALGALSRFERRSTVRTWLIGILRRKLLEHYRRPPPGAPPTTGDGGPRDPRRPRFDERGVWVEPPANWGSPERAFEGHELRAIVEGCVDLLPPHLADAFLLREGDGLDASEICGALDISPSNLRVRLHRARLLLRDCLERRWFGGDGGRPGRSESP